MWEAAPCDTSFKAHRTEISLLTYLSGKPQLTYATKGSRDYHDTTIAEIMRAPSMYMYSNESTAYSYARYTETPEKSTE